MWPRTSTSPGPTPTLKHAADRLGSARELREELRAIPEVAHIALVGGDFDVILLVRAEDNQGLRRVVFDQLQSMTGVLDTQTFLIFEDLDNR